VIGIIRSITTIIVLVFFSLHIPAFGSIQTEADGHVSGETRFGALKTLLTENPEMTIHTRVPSSGLLWNLYELDKSYIEKSIQNRSNRASIQLSLDYISQLAIRENLNQSMSISDLNWIGRIWAYMLSSSPESQKNAAHTNMGPNAFRTDISELLAYLDPANIEKSYKEHLSNTSHFGHWYPSEGFAMPIISPDGAFSFSLLRKTWGFMKPNGAAASYLDFYAVPTDVLVNFDYAIDHPPCDGWEHDDAHIHKYRPTAHIQACKIAEKAAKVSQKVDEADLNEDQLNKVDIAFFHVFHELYSPVFDPHSDIKELRNKILPKISGDIIPGIFFESLEHYNTLVKSAEHLGFIFTGENIIDKHRGYLLILLEGLELLEKYLSAGFDPDDSGF
jgi:hypothetical protein